LPAPELKSDLYWKMVIIPDLFEICLFIMKGLVYVYKIPDFKNPLYISNDNEVFVYGIYLKLKD
jgi:hypothetical protein